MEFCSHSGPVVWVTPTEAQLKLTNSFQVPKLLAGFVGVEPDNLESIVRCAKATAKNVVEGIKVTLPLVSVQNLKTEVSGELLERPKGGAVESEADHEA